MTLTSSVFSADLHVLPNTAVHWRSLGYRSTKRSIFLGTVLVSRGLVTDVSSSKRHVICCGRRWIKTALRGLAHLIQAHVCSFYPCRICPPAHVGCRWPLMVDWVNVLYCNIPKVSSGDSWQWNGPKQSTGSACLKLFGHSQGWICCSRSYYPKKEVRWPFQ